MFKKLKNISRISSSELISNTALFIENYLFFVVLFYLILKQISLLFNDYSTALLFLSRIKGGTVDIYQIAFFSHFFKTFILMLLNFLVAWGLIVRKNLHQKPKGLLEIVVPLLALSSHVLYNLTAAYFPEDLDLILLPAYLFPWVSLIGLPISFMGLVMSTIATYHLRYSYAVFPEVHDVVTNGLYKYVRHPIYSGYIISVVGLCLIFPFLTYILVSIIYVILFIWRATVEERKLAAFSPEYREYRRQTPFLVPIKFPSIKTLKKI